MTEIEIPDEPKGSPEAPEGDSPYKNLLVPLVVVPAGVVMVLVMIYALFGAIAGEEATPLENVDRLLEGGVNERQQAAFNLVRQMLENWEAEAEGREVEWALDPSLKPRIQAAWEETREFEEPGDVAIPLALATILARMGDSEAVAALAEMVTLSEELDPKGEYSAYACFSLSSVAERLSEPDRVVVSNALIAALGDPDEGLSGIAATVLQKFDSPATLAALEEVLGAGSLQLRMNAALSLAHLGSPAGEAVLLEAIQRTPYHEERGRHPEKWRDEALVSVCRREALAALVVLGSATEDVLRGLAEEDEDPHMREAAMRALDGA